MPGSATGIVAIDTIVVGILGYGVRPDLRAANERIKAWAESGGNLITQYHRP